MNSQLLRRDEFIGELQKIGKQLYHNLHPFHKMLYSGVCTKTQMQAWALNRYYYQYSIPIKDALILSKLTNSSDRIQWRSRLVDHDGSKTDKGGIDRWLMLCEGIGLNSDYVKSLDGILPATRFAVDAYVNFVRDRSVLEAVASSLTEMFSPMIIAERVSGMLANYDFVSEDILSYFKPRITQAPKDVDYALDFVCYHANTPHLQHLVCQALKFKCEVLWAMSDALYYSYVSPGLKFSGTFGND